MPPNSHSGGSVELTGSTWSRSLEAGGKRLGAPVELVRGRIEGRVDHAERLKDALLQQPPEAHAGDDLDNAAEHIGRVAVFPDLAWLAQ